MKKSEIPCKPDCPQRSWDCHPKCPEYQDYAARAREEGERFAEIRREYALQRNEDIRRATRGKIK